MPIPLSKNIADFSRYAKISFGEFKTYEKGKILSPKKGKFSKNGIVLTQHAVSKYETAYKSINKACEDIKRAFGFICHTAKKNIEKNNIGYIKLAKF